MAGRRCGRGLHHQFRHSRPPLFGDDADGRRQRLSPRSSARIAAIGAGICNHVLLSLGRTGYSGGRIGARVQQMPQFRLIGEFEMPSGAIAPAQLYAVMARRHMELYGTTSRQLAEIAVTTRRHASLNPNATMRNPITVEDHQASRMISDPLRLLDCSLESDGGAAVVISATGPRARLRNKPIIVMGVGRGPSGLAERDHAAARPHHARPGQGGTEGLRDGRRLSTTTSTSPRSTTASPTS